MQIRILTKNYGSQTINTDTYNPGFASTDSTAFKVIEHMFNEWYDYNTQPAIYSKKGAIRQGIENMIEVCVEEGKTFITTKDILKMDIEAAFE